MGTLAASTFTNSSLPDVTVWSASRVPFPNVRAVSRFWVKEQATKNICAQVRAHSGAPGQPGLHDKPLGGWNCADFTQRRGKEGHQGPILQEGGANLPLLLADFHRRACMCTAQESPAFCEEARAVHTAYAFSTSVSLIHINKKINGDRSWQGHRARSSATRGRIQHSCSPCANRCGGASDMKPNLLYVTQFSSKESTPKHQREACCFTY